MGEEILNNQGAEEHIDEQYTPKSKEEGGGVGLEVLKGRIIESKPKESGPVAKFFSCVGCLVVLLFVISAIFLCFTGIGLIIGIPMIVGGLALMGFFMSVIKDGTKYRIECPICQRGIDTFREKGKDEITLKCPSCKKDIVFRGKEVLHFN